MTQSRAKLPAAPGHTDIPWRQDGTFMIIGANGDSLFKRLMKVPNLKVQSLQALMNQAIGLEPLESRMYII